MKNARPGNLGRAFLIAAFVAGAKTDDFEATPLRMHVSNIPLDYYGDTSINTVLNYLATHDH